jgi:hypothetical protein
MSAQEQPLDDGAIAEMNRILQKVLAHEKPNVQELEFLRELRIDVIDLFQHSRRVEG